MRLFRSSSEAGKWKFSDARHQLQRATSHGPRRVNKRAVESAFDGRDLFKYRANAKECERVNSARLSD